MPKRSRVTSGAGTSTKEEACDVAPPTADVFSKYAYKPPPRSTGVAVQVARVIPAAASSSAPVGLSYDEGSSLAARVCAFADPSSVPAPASLSSPSRRIPTHDLTSCSSPGRAAARSGAVAEASSGAVAAPGGPPAASAELRPRWREQLEGIVEMRAKRDAPVDTLGCERCADPAAPANVQRFQTLLALMLSSQTKDEVTYAAMQRLIAHGCSAAAIAATPVDELEKLIYPVGFYRNKAKFIQAAAARCATEFAGDIPASLEALQTLSGVGPKMAHIAMSAAWKAPVGIGVDTHVHRIANRLGWVRTEAATGSGAKAKAKGTGPEATRAELEGWLPRELWEGVNALLVGFGQQVCQPTRPHCEGCSIAAICPTGRRAAKRA